MDTILTDFISRTKADPALAHDLLDAADWNLEAALAIFDGLKETRAVELPEYEYDPKDFEDPSLPSDGVDFAATSMSPGLASINEVGVAENLDENEAKRRQVVGKQRRHRGRGLSFLADDVVNKFTKVAVSKLKVSSQEQVTIDDQFFHHSFSYPDFSAESLELQDFIAADLLETTHQKALERSGRLNWWTTTGKLPRLEPLATSGDGNCLLHAASLYMWGFHDRELILRTALHRLLTTSHEYERIKRRWRYQTQLRNNEAGGLTFSEEEWEFEWGEIVRIATNQPRRQPTTASLRRYSSLRFSYESLEEIHIFALAHVLKRPIIVISDNAIKNFSGEDLAPIYFGGIYLPLEISATACSKTPVVLAYDASHFSPLVARRDTLNQPGKTGRFSRLSSRTETVIPLVSPSGALLPVQFIIDPKKRSVSEKWGDMKYSPGEFPDEIIHLLDQYLKIRWVQLNVASVSSTDEDYDHLFPIQVPKVRFPSAVIFQDTQPIYQKELVEKYLENVRDRYAAEKERKEERERERVKRLQEIPVPCEGAGCDMFGKGSTNNLCSMCYQKWEKAKVKGDSQPEVKEEDKENQEDLDNDDPGVVFSSSAAESQPQNNLPPNHLPPKQLPPKQLPTRLSPTKHPPPRHPPPVYPGAPVDQAEHHRDNVQHRDKSPSASVLTEIQPSSLNNQQLRETKKSEGKTSPSRSYGEKPLSADNLTAGGGKGKDKGSPSHTSDKPWTKKLNIFQNIAPFAKSNAAKSGSGYTRDNIQPIKLSDDSGGVRPVGIATGSQRTKCINSGCEFFGGPEREGYCSSCFKELQQGGPISSV